MKKVNNSRDFIDFHNDYYFYYKINDGILADSQNQKLNFQ